ncbi:MAG: radical SAM family heme chaperone HemW [Gammaproteobacteria bacterium]|nr:radical SAM family heme chaperone HemW [Gammaproteobacteria bacterium]MYD80906.1 radical SAM family heme chaperone HemW [Gammaproteobacteria bacterium]
MAGLYVHIPWCVRKCPYCDFNSHEIRNDFEESKYVDRVIADLKNELENHPLQINTVYFGGGTPSLFSPDSFYRILATLRQAQLREVTMEANPGTTEHVDFRHYRNAGITRVSLGAQSFHLDHLKALGRIHGPLEASRAIEKALTAGLDSVNVDLMYGLPNQTIDQAMEDLQTAIALGPQHISWYELTIEPNTVFAKSPPKLASTDYRAEMEEEGVRLLADNGFERYEVSAYARNDLTCEHNLNYWLFGDYFGVGAGAHGKLSTGDGILRTSKARMPKSYMQGTKGSSTMVTNEDIPVEFMMNALRLCDGVEEDLFHKQTGLPFCTIRATVERLRSWDLMQPNRLQLTPKGFQQLNGVVSEFLSTTGVGINE